MTDLQTPEEVFAELLRIRGLTDADDCKAFLAPSYDAMKHDPFLLPEMREAVERLVAAREANELIYIYGDYDIDGLTATTILFEAFTLFGFQVKTFIPNRFHDGYGLSKPAIKELADKGTTLLVTVDCGSLSHKEIEYAKELGIDVIVTDHHNVSDSMPPAVATINPKRSDHNYPFCDLAGCGVAFKLVQALQSQLEGLPAGQEKWFLDLVALGTVCDIVGLIDENRANVYWGLRVLAKTRRPGLKALAAVAGISSEGIRARNLGFVIGPHLNAAGRLETAQLSLDLLTTRDGIEALGIAETLREMNRLRRSEQDRIFHEAIVQAEQYIDDPVLVLSDPSWSHGIIGIVAAKVLEALHKPTFVLQEIGEEAKGSARSFGDFSAVAAIHATQEWLIRGGGHKLAAGVSLKSENIPHFRQALVNYYRTLDLKYQDHFFDIKADITLNTLEPLTLQLVQLLSQLEPYGHSNHEPVFKLNNMHILERKEMGEAGRHIKLHITDSGNHYFSLVGFNLSKDIQAQKGDRVDLWIQLLENEWRGVKNAEGRLLKVVSAEN